MSDSKQRLQSDCPKPWQVFFGTANVPLPCTLVSTSTYHTVGQGLSFDGSWRRMVAVAWSWLATPSK